MNSDVHLRFLLGGVNHARQRSVREKQHKLDCERVTKQLLGGNTHLHYCRAFIETSIVLVYTYINCTNMYTIILS